MYSNSDCIRNMTLCIARNAQKDFSPVKMAASRAWSSTSGATVSRIVTTEVTNLQTGPRVAIDCIPIVREIVRLVSKQ